jgi:hypothetical protein
MCRTREGRAEKADAMGTRTIGFLAIVLMALALVPAGAHLFEMPSKMTLGRDAYFTVQQIYAGWALFGIVLFGALGTNLALAVALRRQHGAFLLALFGFAAMATNLAVFFLWTFPANQATTNWTEIPAHWEALRAQWEYSHAANALLTFAGFCAVTLASLASRPLATSRD